MDDSSTKEVWLIFSASKNIAEDYLFYRKMRHNALHDVLLPFLLLPAERWSTPRLEDEVRDIIKEQGSNPSRIKDYQAEIGPYCLCVRSDHSQREDSIYRAEIYHREIPENTEKGMAFKCTPEEAMTLYFNIDYIVRNVEGRFETEITETADDINALLEIRSRLTKQEYTKGH